MRIPRRVVLTLLSLSILAALPLAAAPAEEATTPAAPAFTAGPVAGGPCALSLSSPAGSPAVAESGPGWQPMAAPPPGLCMCGSCCQCDCQVSSTGTCCGRAFGSFCVAVALCTCPQCAIEP